MPPSTMRISRFLARCGVASRRKAEEIVQAGRVSVNGAVETNLATQIDPKTDKVELDGQLLQLAQEQLTLMVNKPRRVLVSRGDPQDRRTIYDVLPEEYADDADRLLYVGRLDFFSEGLLLLTTDGDLVHRLTHPSNHVEKEYLAWLNRELTPEEETRIRDGIDLEDGPAAPAQLDRQETKRGVLYRIIIHEGRNRQVRRMFEALGVRVDRLLRVRIGGLRLRGMEPGKWRPLTGAEIRKSFPENN
ncbi:rRNA pseudouridine synthase [bacterium]|nr:rRNA pseudouridine synthase [bacterium]